uniref:Uncharacterized protein n=1 Tax=Setaria viridis TaxID=4556 RepID=A0A4U6W7F0_SETVI|nr:hypothetical protein SEVIR_1G071200v2 [Setaria viridis]
MTLLEKIRALPPSTFRPFYPRTVERGTRSVKEAKSWTCQQCQHENRPTKHLLFDLPAANCDVCGFPPPEGAADFAFCYADLGMNGFCPIGNVKKQKTKEVLTKDGPFMNIEDLLGKYHKRCTGKGDGPNYEYNLQSLLDMLSILVADGVRELEHNNVHKIAGWTFLGADDFAAVCAALADGYPLITGFNCGKRAALLKIGEIYVPPALNSVSADGKRKPVGHCVVLVGAEQAKTEKIVHFLNSAGEEFCERSHKEGDVIHGGVGAIRFKDLLLPPIQILRFNERREQVDISHEAS